jgi:hypothetical protein
MNEAIKPFTNPLRIDRNIKRLEQNKKAYRDKLDDFENTFSDPYDLGPSKYEEEAYYSNYSGYIQTCEELEYLKKVKAGEL